MTEPLRPDDTSRPGEREPARADAHDRPGYPPRALDWWGTRGAFGPRVRVLDLAAGTGTLTQLLPRECRVVAVEPSAERCAAFDRAVGDVHVIEGCAEAIPLQAGSFDTVLVAQAFHRFDAPVALDEIARVLRPGGGLGLVWNQDDVFAEEWLEELEAVKRAVAGSPMAAAIASANAISDHSAFDGADQTEIRWRHVTTADAVVSDISSRRYMAHLPEDRQRAVLARVRAIVEPLGSVFDYPYRTIVFWARRSGWSSAVGPDD